MTDPKESKKQKQSNKVNDYARFTGVAFQMIAIIGIGTFIGVKLDLAYPNKYSLFTVVLSLLAVGMAMYFVIRQVNSTKKDN